MRLLSLTLLTLVISSCNESPYVPKPEGLTYSYFAENVFKPKCISCHNGGFIKGDFRSYEGVIAFSARLCDALKGMPPSLPLNIESPQLTEEVCEWVDDGLPQ